MASHSDKHSALFAALVSTYTTQAMVCLGKLANPTSGELERDLEHASMMIDMLGMLEAMTEGNRTDEETSALRQSLSMLRLNYVAEVNKPDTVPPRSDADHEDSVAERETSDASASTEGGGGESSAGSEG